MRGQQIFEEICKNQEGVGSTESILKVKKKFNIAAQIISKCTSCRLLM